MFSKTCEYAIRAMIYIAQQSAVGKRVGFQEVADEIEAPKSFIAKILQELSRKKLVESAKGPNGGFFVDQQAMNLPLSEIVKAFDGDKIFTGCGLGLPYCSEVNPCPIHHEFKAIRNQIAQMLQSSTIGEYSDLLDQKLVRLKRS